MGLVLVLIIKFSAHANHCRLIPKKEPGKKDKIAKLKALQVFLADRVIQNWSVKVGTESILGRQKDGNVVLSTEHGPLLIFFKEGYLERHRIPTDLIEAIAGFCAIEDLYLLGIAITETPQTIRECFQRHGVPALNLEDEPIDETPDIDDFDPRKLYSSDSAKTSRSTLHVTNIQEDLIGLFAPIAFAVNCNDTGSQILGRGLGGTSLAWFLQDGSSELGLNGLWADEGDCASIKSEAESTLSGTTFGGSDMRILVPTDLSTGCSIDGFVGREIDNDLEFVGQRKVRPAIISEKTKLKWFPLRAK